MWNHMTRGPFVHLVEWKIWKRSKRVFAFGNDQKNTSSGDKAWIGHVLYRKRRYFSLVSIVFDPVLSIRAWYRIRPDLIFGIGIGLNENYSRVQLKYVCQIKNMQPWSDSLKAFKIESSVVKILWKTLISLTCGTNVMPKLFSTRTLSTFHCCDCRGISNWMYGADCWPVSESGTENIFEATLMIFRCLQRTWPTAVQLSFFIT